ncbi:MAG: SpoIIE family protein phosphatase [Phormidesmis sp.]
MIFKFPFSSAQKQAKPVLSEPASSLDLASQPTATALGQSDDLPLEPIDILIIDDDPSILLSLQRLLQKRGYQVATASSAAVGLQKAQREPSVIICDWMLPGDIQGIDICHQIKQNPNLSTTAFLMMTSHTDVANRVEALEAGADDLLFKPIDTAELIARVKAGLRLHQLTQALRAQTRRLEAELAEAATYVASLLPIDTPKGSVGEAHHSAAIASCFISSQALGGDCFDHYWLDPDYLVIYLLDVSGHGLGAALLSTSVLNVLRSQSLPNVNFYRPETVLRGLNETFQMTDQNEKYFTIWYGVYNRATRELSYASAGHPPAVLVSPATRQKPATLSQLRTPGMPIGMMPDTQYQWQRCSIAQGDRLYIFSDGIYEIYPIDSGTLAQRHLDTPQLGLDGFVTLLACIEADGQLSVDSIIEQVGRIGGPHFSDDLSLLEVVF